ncbi:hypothetical protein jhhlp_004241 [Lomentospora prolificans]|uniref:Major facilitator superfamily (MFS) profile domain-containing protein n=1 Tax=Lomentospora prolificans TaxID=41688 RepID=A0A2N3NB65_9PEZI|nr:hypothetical protein jhhlp_004241 [Lomentospora prolificans]
MVRSPASGSLSSSGKTRLGAAVSNRGFFDSIHHGRQLRRQSYRYHTFPTPPLATPRDTNRDPPGPSESSSHASSSSSQSPLPVKELSLLAILSFAEQTALNSISPYLPSMILSFPEIQPQHVGLYVGLVASVFALAQLSTNFLWGYLSDKIGRKPVLILGTSLLAGCFVVFGFCKAYWQVILVQIAMGMLNGNAAVVPTALGDLTDKSNQSTAFTWLPVIYSLGSITGPAIGGLLVGTMGDEFPFLASNLVSALILAIGALIVAIWMEEPHEDKPEVHVVRSIRKHFQETRRRSNASSSWTWFIQPKKGRSDHQPIMDGADGHHGSDTTSHHSHDDEDHDRNVSWKDSLREIFNRSTISLLLSYLVYQFSNISFNSLYPIFATAPSPTGRDLDPGTIGVSLSVAGIFTIVFQLLAFQYMKTRLGNLGLYRVALLGLTISMALMPWTGHLDSDPPFAIGTGKEWLYAELGGILIIKNISAVGGLSCVMLLITNSAVSDSSLGTLNGIAQTISAAGRSIGPFLAGSVFSLGTHIKPRGEALSWGLFGGIALLGWFATWGIDGKGLESDDWEGDADSVASV